MKKPIKTSLFVLIICMIFTGCRQETWNGSALEIIDIESNIDNYSDQLRLSDIAEDIEYISFEKTSNSILDDIRYMDLTETHILIRSKSKVQLFDKNGKYLREVGHKGNGPFEYSLAGAPVIFNDSIIMPLVIPEKKIFVFTTSGKPISSISIPIANGISGLCNNWYYVAPNFLIQVPNYSGKEKYRIVKVNRLGEIVSGYPNTTFFNGPAYNMSSGTAITENQFYSYNDRIMYREILNDTLWQLTNDLLKPRYVLKRGKYGILNSYRAMKLDEYYKQLENQIAIDWVLESGEYLFFKTELFRNYPFSFGRVSKNYYGNEKKYLFPVLGCYNKKTRETFFIKPTNPDDQIEPTGIHNDFDGGINFMPNNVGHNQFAYWIQPYDLKKYVTTDCFKNSTPKYPEKKRELEKLANSLNENDNPVLMVVKLKE